MIDLRWLRPMVRSGLLGIFAMTVLVSAVLLARGTTGCDWRAADQLTLAEIMLLVGFSEYTLVAYRTTYGGAWNIPRGVLVEHEPTMRARQRILSTIGDGVLLGTGVGGTVFCLTLFGAARHVRHDRAVTTVEPTPVAYLNRNPSAWNASGCIAGWLSLGSGSRRAGFLLIPVEVEDVADVAEVLVHADLRGSPTSCGSGVDVPRRPPALPVSNVQPDAGASEGGAGQAPTAASANPEPGSARQSPGRSAESSRKHGTGRDGGTVARGHHKCPQPDDDGGWF